MGGLIFLHHSDLSAAVTLSIDNIVAGRLDELPPYREPAFPVPEDERCTLFDWMVLT